MLEHPPHRTPRVLRAENLGVALARRDEDRNAGDDEHEPSRQRDRRRHATGDGSEHEAAGDGRQVKQKNVAPDERVAQRQSEVAEADRGQERSHEHADHQAEHH